MNAFVINGLIFLFIGCSEYGESYLIYHEWGITDCISSHGEITHETCKATCDDDTNCLAFVDLIDFDVCIFCAYTPSTHPGKWVEDSIVVTFIRNCVSATGSTNGTIGSPCNSDADCVATHTQCLAHVCLCSPGYVIDTNTLQCVTGKWQRLFSNIKGFT